ncbi:zinc finger protein 501-like [Megalobrama amblycephala]|uniref:zinc finger protein 501-like n=1 Tax=Megalobrama amblycephala TaxID=75352 RepID=UPI0020145A42|nr:zinc finger protein 501-like [Megalobrama amblycephala]
MAFIKEESEDMKIEETFRVNQDTEEQTDLMLLKVESEVLNDTEEKDQYEKCHAFITREKSFSCSDNEKTSSRRTAQKTGDGSYFTCFKCGKCFSQHENLTVHMGIHTGESPYTCQQCGKCFTQKGTLNRHMRIHTGESTFTCQQCGKSFTQKGNLKKHMRIHTGEKPYSCRLCAKSFTAALNLKYHMNRHSGEKPFRCDQCEKRFTRKVHFNNHMKIHSKENCFICHQCGKSFPEKGNLKIHMRLHTGEKPYTCPQCRKSFTYKKSLDAHMRNHTGENPFTCHLCGKSFTQKGNLKIHMGIHTGESSYSCQQCGNDCSPIHPSNTIVKFADDTTIVGLITDNSETSYREEIHHFTEWCSQNNQDLYMTKTKELIVDFRKSKCTEYSVLCIHNNEVERCGPSQNLIIMQASRESCENIPEKSLSIHNTLKDGGVPAFMVEIVTVIVLWCYDGYV